MRSLENIDTSTISKAELAEAISKAYGEDKISPGQSTSLVNLIMSSGDSIDRSKLKQALIANEDKMAILEDGKASVEPIVDQVMEVLNDSSSGDIQKHEFS